MKSRRTAVIVSCAAFGLGVLAGCASETAESTATTTAAAQAPSGEAATATDVAFAQSMIPHHQQAVEMADLALSPESQSSAQVKALAEQIKSAQDPEIQQMTGWLQQWGAPTAMPGATDDDMAGMDHSGHDMGGMTMAGMMTAEQMQQLQDASGQQFDQMWLEMMIAHHEGAIEMAEQVQGSTNPQVADMADAIISAQEAEITEMQVMLSGGSS